MHPLNHFYRLLEKSPDSPMVIQGSSKMSRKDIYFLAAKYREDILETFDTSNIRLGMISLGNSPDFISSVLALWSLNIVPVLVSKKYTKDRIKDLSSFHKISLHIDSKTKIAASEARWDWNNLDPEMDASVVFTSGSTGLPKGVVQSGRTLSDGVARVTRSMSYREHEKILVPIPFVHDYGWGQALSSIVGGHSLILTNDETIQSIAPAVNEHHPTIFAGVPTIYSGILSGLSGFDEANTDSITKITSSGSRFPLKLYNQLQERIPTATIYRNYGMTETYRSCCLEPNDQMIHSYDNPVGTPIAGVDISIISENGEQAPVGTIGRVVHVGSGVFDRYLNDPVATEKAKGEMNGQPCVYTGDLGVKDEKGTVYILGREDRLIKVFDMRVSLSEIEDSISNVIRDLDIAVVAIEDEGTNVSLHAFIAGETISDVAKIRRDVNASLPTHMRITKFHALREIPKTPVGKIDYPKLKTISQGITR